VSLQPAVMVIGHAGSYQSAPDRRALSIAVLGFVALKSVSSGLLV
jgi:hypothetical protein